VVHGHGLNGNGSAWIEKLVDHQSLVGFKSNLAKPVIWTGSGGFCV
jgi:hypothetical protein